MILLLLPIKIRLSMFFLTGRLQHPGLARQKQGSHPGVRRATHAGIQRSTLLHLLQRPRRW